VFTYHFWTRVLRKLQKETRMDEAAKTPISSTMPGHLIRRLHQISTNVFTQRVRDAGFDLTPVQFAALDALRHNPGSDQASLAQSIAKDRATIGAVVERLAQKGLLTRVVSSRDKRSRELVLTKDGEALIAKLTPIVERLQKDILPGLDESEYRQFVALAAKATQNAGILSVG